MLSDFLLLETYYDSPEAAQAYEDMARKYGPAAVRDAVRGGLIRPAFRRCCPEGRGPVFWLTEKGRIQARDLSKA